MSRIRAAGAPAELGLLMTVSALVGGAIIPDRVGIGPLLAGAGFCLVLAGVVFGTRKMITLSEKVHTLEDEVETVERRLSSATDQMIDRIGNDDRGNVKKFRDRDGG
jgi:hypothetical protein